MSASPGLARSHQSIDPVPVITMLQDGLKVDWQVPEPAIRVNENGYTEIEMAGFDLNTTPGSLVLPFKSILIAVPQGSLPTIEIEEQEIFEMELLSPIAQADTPERVQISDYGYTLSEASGDITWRGQIPSDEELAVEIIGTVRGVKLARLTFSPVMLEGDRLKITNHLKAIVHFNRPAASPVKNQLESDPLLGTLEHLVVNPDQIVPIDREVTTSKILLPDKDIVALEVSQTGITAVSFEDLQDIRYPLEDVNPQHLHLYHAGQEVAYRWEGDGDAHFEPGERLLFFAEPRFSRWATFDTYFLWGNGQSGLRMGSRSADPIGLDPGDASFTASFEQNHLYTPDCFCAPIPAGRDGDRWVWDRVQYPDYPARSYPIELSSVDVSSPARLKIWLIGYTDLTAEPDHKLRIALNGTEIGTAEWDGKENFSGDYVIPSGILLNGENILELSLVAVPGISLDGVWLDAFEVGHVLAEDVSIGKSVLFTGEATPHAYTLRLDFADGLQGYDVTDPHRPIILTGIENPESGMITLGDAPESGNRRYWLTTDGLSNSPDRLRLVSPLQDFQDASGGEYLIISPGEFIPALDELIALRTSQGLKVAVRDVLSIYDYFGWGIPDPEAIRKFIEFAYRSWERKPVYVLLVGDGTADPKRYLESSGMTFIPPYLAEVDPWAGETAADNRYVSVDGEDILPDMLIGRLPANSPKEARVMVEKIVDYEDQRIDGEWIRTALFVADDPDSAGKFPELSDQVLAGLPSPPFRAKKFYFDPMVVSPQQFREDLIEAWNEGSSLIMYTGHASIHQWAGENFFHMLDVPSLTNGHQLPVLLEMTCFTGAFQVPGFSTLDESLVRFESGGVIAAWGSSGLGIATGHRWLAQGFMNSVYNQGHVNLGMATLAGRLNVAKAGVYLDLIDTFNLLGDPATSIIRTYYLFAPFTRK